MFRTTFTLHTSIFSSFEHIFKHRNFCFWILQIKSNKLMCPLPSNSFSGFKRGFLFQRNCKQARFKFSNRNRSISFKINWYLRVVYQRFVFMEKWNCFRIRFPVFTMHFFNEGNLTYFYEFLHLMHCLQCFKEYFWKQI